MKYADMSVRGKLLAGFSVLLILMVVVSATALLKMSAINEDIRALLQERYAKTKLSNDAIKHAGEVGRFVRSAILADEAAELDSDIQRIEQLRKMNTEAFDKIKTIGLHPGSKGETLFNKVQELRTVLAKEYEPFYALVRKHDAEAAKVYLKKNFVPANNAYMTAIEEYVAYNEGKMKEAEQSMESAYHSARTVLLLTLVAAIVLGVAGAIFTSGDLSSRISIAASMAARVAGGDLQAQSMAVSASRDEVGQLLIALEDMRNKLLRTVAEVMAEAQSVSSSASQLSSAAQQVVAGTATQSQSTSSAAAAVEELTVSIDHVANNASDAHQRAKDAGGMAASSGGDVKAASQQVRSVASSVEASAVTLHELSEQVQEIGNVTTVIREVADQTNLLALNAAIEAARAGEQGRGFAVVADEVRKLAERTTHSVQEISTMIAAIQQGAASAVASMQSSRDMVNGVVTTAERAGDSMGDIESSTGSVQEAVAAISEALREQRSTSTELAKNVEQIAQMSEENLAAVESVAGTAHSLAESATKLQGAIRYFKI